MAAPATNPLTRRDALALCAGLWLVDASHGAASRQHRRHHLFGSPVDLLAPAEAPPSTLDAVMNGLQTMHRRWNAWKPGDVTTLNRAFREGRPARASAVLIAMIRNAAVLEQQSLGLFNPGLGGLVGAWGFHDDVLRPGTVPRAAELARWTRDPPSLAQIEIRGGLLRSLNPALQLDFGAYAKGVAIDWGLDRLRAAGVERALLNLGGNLAAMGAPWTIGLRSPFDDGLVATLSTQGREAVVTSGSYERFRLLDGERATHILDPLSGRPAPEIVSVTVVHARADLADAAATALLVAGAQRWRTVAERMGVEQLLLIDRHGRATATPRLAARLQPASPGWGRRLRLA